MSHSADISHLAEELRASYDSRTRAIAALEAATAQQIAEMQAQHQAMATAQQQRLRQDANTRREAVNKLLHDMQAERTSATTAQHERLSAFARDLQQTTDQFLADQAAARKAMSASQQAELERYNKELQQRTTAALAEAATTRKTLHDDHAKAHETWAQFTQTMHQQRARKS